MGETPEAPEVSEVVTIVDPKEEVVATATSNSTACKVEQSTAFTTDESPASPDLPSSPEVGEGTPESMWTPKWLLSNTHTPRRRQRTPEAVVKVEKSNTPVLLGGAVTLGSLEVMPYD